VRHDDLEASTAAGDDEHIKVLQFEKGRFGNGCLLM
jgi:hypothetical protein